MICTRFRTDARARADQRDEIDVTLAMLRKSWNARIAMGRQQLASLQESLHDIERKLEQLLNRLILCPVVLGERGRTRSFPPCTG